MCNICKESSNEKYQTNKALHVSDMYGLKIKIKLDINVKFTVN